MRFIALAALDLFELTDASKAEEDRASILVRGGSKLALYLHAQGLSIRLKS